LRALSFISFTFTIALAACSATVKPLPDLPPPEYEPGRRLDLGAPKPPASASAAPRAEPKPVVPLPPG
jgi:hypothetical protein